uniref:Uncharacterized protein n=1 Tax=Anguilla anguilla TaxID=7936 RepID=A0A0E9TGG1_ANGAN
MSRGSLSCRQIRELKIALQICPLCHSLIAHCLIGESSEP